MSNNTERITITVPAGDRERLREHARRCGYKSVSELIYHAYVVAMENDAAVEECAAECLKLIRKINSEQKKTE